MIKLEIICNQAMEDDIIETLGRHGFGENFTYLYPVYGRGRHGRREGSPIWPEENVLFLLMIDEEPTLIELVAEIMSIKQKFHSEGLRCYVERDVHRLI